MDNRILIGFALFLGVFLAFPLLMQVSQQKGAETDPGATNAATGTPNAAGDQNDPRYNQPPLLNAQNLVNTDWKMQAGDFLMRITLGANGACYASHPLMRSLTGQDYIEGRWWVQYDKLFIEAQLGDTHFYEELKISGNNAYSGTRLIERY